MSTRPKPIVKVLRYSDPDRKMLAKQAAIFLGKKDEDNIRRPLNLLRSKHMSIFRGENVDFEFYASKVVYDHLVTYSTIQRRACAGLRANKAEKFVVPLEVDGTGIGMDLEVIADSIIADYDALLEVNGVRKQVARAILPMSVQLHFSLQFNFQTLMEALFPQRLWTPGAQPDTYEITKMMFDAVFAIDPELWSVARETFGEEAIRWDELRRRLRKSGITISELLRAGVDVTEPLIDVLFEIYNLEKSMWD